MIANVDFLYDDIIHVVLKRRCKLLIFVTIITIIMMIVMIVIIVIIQDGIHSRCNAIYCSHCNNDNNITFTST